MMLRLQPGKVVVLEHHARALQLLDGGGDVGDPEADRRVLGLGAFRLRKQREGAAADLVDELAVGVKAARLQPQGALVEGARPFHVLDGQHGRDSGAGQHGYPFRSRLRFASLSNRGTTKPYSPATWRAAVRPKTAPRRTEVAPV